MPDLGELIAERIRTSGPISFAEFMDLSLYHPDLGYYARAAQRTGRAGDFFTSVDVGSVFGELLAKQLAEMWRILQARSPNSDPQSLPFDLVEAGAGSGRLSRDVLDAAQREDPDFYAALRVSLVERSPAARTAHSATLGQHARLLHYSSATLPASVHGVIFANELLDALPTHAVAMTKEGLREVFVDYSEGRFVERLQPPSTPKIAEYLSRAGASLGDEWRAEVNLAAEHWVRDAARALHGGFLIVIDYGHDEAALYGASHASGTLATFKRHTTEDDALGGALQDPGSCDITAHVDLTAVSRAANEEGLTPLGRLDQTYFMLGLGMDSLLAMVSDEGSVAALQRRLQLKTLMLPGGLGSTHKVLLFGRNVGTPKLRCLSYKERLT